MARFSYLKFQAGSKASSFSAGVNKVLELIEIQSSSQKNSRLLKKVERKPPSASTLLYENLGIM